MTARVRVLGLPVVALALVAGVLTVQLAYGGGDFTTLRPADPCAERTVTSRSDGIEGLTERVVLLGVDAAACRLGVSREELTLDLGQGDARSDAEIDALRAGLADAVRRLDDEDALPPASELVDEALESADLNRFLKAAIRALPDAVVDAALKTNDVLLRTVDDLDLRAVLGSLEDQGDLNAQLEAAVVQAVQDSLADRVRDLI